MSTNNNIRGGIALILWSLPATEARRALRRAVKRMNHNGNDEGLAACIEFFYEFDEHSEPNVEKSTTELIQLAQTLQANVFPETRRAIFRQLAKAWYPDHTPRSARIFQCFCELGSQEQDERAVADVLLGRLCEFHWTECDPKILLALLEKTKNVPDPIKEKLVIAYIKRVGAGDVLELIRKKNK